MDERSLLRLWTMRAAFLALGVVIVSLHLLPYETTPRFWAPPDLLLAFSLAWTLRRPDFAPVLSVAAVMVLADLMFHRPPGLHALLVVIGVVLLRGRFGGSWSETGFATEWSAVASVIVAVALAERLMLAIFVVGQAPLGLTLIQMAATVAAYPLVVLVTEWGMGVRRPKPLEAVGARS
jgi:rod shape-determining protein MreD